MSPGRWPRTSLDEPLVEPSRPREVMFLTELTALDDSTAVFSSSLHVARFVLPVEQWLHLQRPGHLAGRFVATPPR